jgi:hypothetical protein
MMARSRNETLLSAILYHWFMVTWCKLLTTYLTQRYDHSWRHVANDTQSFDVVELPTMRRCSWLSVWPSYMNYLCYQITLWVKHCYPNQEVCEVLAGIYHRGPDLAVTLYKIFYKLLF